MQRGERAPERRARVGLVVVWPEQPGDGVAGVRPPRDCQIDEEGERLAGIYGSWFVIDLDAWRPKHVEGDLCHESHLRVLAHQYTPVCEVAQSDYTNSPVNCSR